MMPLSVTEILPAAGTGRSGSALGTGADDGLTAQPAGLLTAVVGDPALGALVEHAVTVMAMVAVAIKQPRVSRWWRLVLIMVVIPRYFWPG
ncbi:hypothetical protein [Mycobacterium sp. 852002-51057_SCH5723018]|uniref:hypothetical protein n=1 Tax=Mycobacterium sp. 852002-51057_SCH5723018 TaxID=1834094 RepID=UPI0018D32C72|nr:hypothetical protein [Mycobacterium sp. 852002-51057_SCH5723018]